MATLKVDFPQGKQQVGDNATLEYNNSYIRLFNNNLNRVQKFLDKTVADNLKAYVSYRTGVQEAQTRSFEEGTVSIDVPYAEYQAYSKRIKKRVGKRGTQPFERMVVDKKEVILAQVQEYSRRLNNG